MMLIPSTRETKEKHTFLIAFIKFQLVLMIIYEGWYLEKYTAIPGVLQLLAISIVGSTLLLLLSNPECGKNKLIKFWFSFGLYSIFASLVVDADMSIVLNSLFTFFSFISVVYCAGVISSYTSDYSWFSKAILLTSVISAFFALFYGVPYQNGAYFVTTMSEYNNPNNLGLLMCVGTFVALFPERNPRPFGWLARMVMLVAFLVVTVNTGSRSSLLCEVAVIILFLYARIKRMKGTATERLTKKIALIVSVFVIAIVVASFIGNANVSGSAIRRLVDKFNVESFSGRTVLYNLAWDMYKEHPIFGIGYNCFANMSGYGYFTHSTYMELLACTGSIGFILFMSPVLSGTVRGLRSFKKDEGRSTTILLMMLVSGLFGIVYYNMVFLMVLYLEISRIPDE